MTKGFRSIRSRLLATYFILTMVAILVLGAYLARALEQFFLDGLDQRLFSEAQLTRELVRPALADLASTPALEGQVRGLGRETGARVTVIAADGTVLADSERDPATMENHRSRPEVQAALAGGTGRSTRYSTTLDKKMMYLALPVDSPGGQRSPTTAPVGSPVGVVRLALPVADIHHGLDQLGRRMLAGIAIATVVAAVVSLRLAASLTRPIERVTRAAREIARGNFRQVLDSRRGDELGELATTLQAMALTIEQQIRELAEEKGRLESVLANMVSGVIFVDQRGRVVLSNPAARQLLDIPAVEAGRYHLEVTKNSQLSKAIDQVLATGVSQQVEITLLYPPDRVLQCHLAPIHQDSGDPLGLVAVLHDISELRRLERMRAELVATVSHELKTPVTAIKGFAETLLEGSLEDAEQTREFIHIIDAEAGRLARLIHDLLELAKLESGQIELKLKTVDLRGVARAVSVKERPLADKSGIELTEEFPDAPVTVTADPERVEQILHNLVENSLRYTPSGGRVTIMVGSTPGGARLGVNDTGVGIPPEDLGRIFERFYRVDRARSRKFGGSGLGLAIVKHIVEAHRGRVWAESEPGRGSTFWVEFPGSGGARDGTPA